MDHDTPRENRQQSFGSLTPDDRERLLRWLCDAYREEVQDVTQFERHAERMYYPQFRERLRRIAAEEQAHVQWLREQILALGGQPPAAAPPAQTGHTNWRNLRLDFDEKKRSDVALLEGINAATHLGDEFVTGLRRIRETEARHREEIREMLMKTEPDAVPAPVPADDVEAGEKKAWLEREKMAWLERRKAEWEARGRPDPWAAWIQQQELKWVTELPNRELEWAQRKNR
jgi:rubrerythrin